MIIALRRIAMLSGKYTFVRLKLCYMSAHVVLLVIDLIYMLVLAIIGMVTIYREDLLDTQSVIVTTYSLFDLIFTALILIVVHKSTKPQDQDSQALVQAYAYMGDRASVSMLILSIDKGNEDSTEKSNFQQRLMEDFKPHDDYKSDLDEITNLQGSSSYTVAISLYDF